MFRILAKFKSKKAQNTAEYALLIALVVAAVIAMQTYAQRALQSRIRGAAGTYLTGQTGALGADTQYEPYYLRSNYNVDSRTSSTERLDTNLVSMQENSIRNRQSGGFQAFEYDASINGVGNGV